jgi:16S rRNA G966 N2-methylase RsmD
MLTMGFQYMIRHPYYSHYNDVPHSHATDNWDFEGGEPARQQRMEEVGIDKLLHEEKHRNFFKGGTWELQPKEIEKIELDEVAYFSLCPKTHADQITEGIVNLLQRHRLNPKEVTITDGCAGVGGVSMSLIVSDKFRKVISVEMDPSRANLLTKNINAIKRPNNSTEIEIQQKNYLDAMQTLEQDVVFFDPPFGGPGYKYYKKAVLFLGGKHMADIANELLTKSKTKYVLIRTPENFWAEYLEKKLCTNLHCYRFLNLDTTRVFVVEKYKP